MSEPFKIIEFQQKDKQGLITHPKGNVYTIIECRYKNGIYRDTNLIGNGKDVWLESIEKTKKRLIDSIKYELSKK